MLKLEGILHSKQIFFLSVKYKIIVFFLGTDFMFLITSSVFFSFKPFTTQPKLATSEKTVYISASPATGSGLNLALILKPLYVTVINVNVIRPLSNSTKKPLNLFLCLFNVKETY
jgi:hypothetical protein